MGGPRSLGVLISPSTTALQRWVIRRGEIVLLLLKGRRLSRSSIPLRMSGSVDFGGSSVKSDDGDYRSAFQIDCLVYDLYGLTEVEIALVEGA